MMNTFFFIHAVCFAFGFWWVASQKEVELSKILFALTAGAGLAVAGLWGQAALAHDSILNHMPMFSLSAVLGACLFLWLRARDQLTQKMTQESVYLLTLSFMYFLSPWTGVSKTIGMIAALPCALALAACWRERSSETGARIGLMFWAMIISIVIGVMQIMASPESFTPSKWNLALSLFTKPTMLLQTFLQAASLVTLALNLVPFLDWARESTIGNPFAANHHVLAEKSSMKRMFYLTLFHGAPLAVNWKYGYFSSDAMMTYALVWSPIVSAKLADAFGPAPRAEIPGWDHDVTQAS